MTDAPITQTQLDALERVADKVFGKLGIDIDFTRHFLDRVNDERNRKQITVRELGQLFGKEYHRWGRDIAKMKVDSQAVMKDLSTAINIPFILSKDGNGKSLVAKTVMRKPDFTTLDRKFPVESVEAGKPDPVEVRRDNIKKKNISNADLDKIAATSKLMKQQPRNTNEEMYGAKKGKQVKGRSATPSKRKPTTGGSSPHPMRGKLVGEADADKPKYDIVANNTGKVIDTFDNPRFAKMHYWVEKGWATVQPQNKKPVTELDEPPLDVKTLTPTAIADKHDVDLGMIQQQLTKGIKVEMEHTPNKMTAMEIALDHLAEMPDYYSKLSDMETGISEMLSKGAWEVAQLHERVIDPQEQILRKALQYMDHMIKEKGDTQSIGGYAFDISRSFNLKGIITSRELAELYRDWKTDAVIERKT
jgi:hypothetical protein